MSAYTDRLRETALAECHHGEDERCEHRSAALAYRLVTQGRGIDVGALLAVVVLGAAFLFLAIHLVIWWQM